ncbi:cupin-like domain-containing protein [Actinoplanes sp. Pm04-4]|uniref:Cupin-like domain-containing protein n=1 Tax=Paractinoplanes pyxinae TaxID=2997416 RepID=A0ABT4B0E4_9ACTN|nr:cupin domain-containing protein [Actinoplanes pyxinae]MCY1139557.1 cupin-like domain-containing protein [Actinoplanes pyxinae]
MPGFTDEAPGGSRPALSRAVSVEPGKFAAAYWGKAPLLSRAGELAGAGGFTDLLSPDAVDELLSRRGLRTPFLRVAQQGKVLPPSRFTGGGGAGAEISDQVQDDQVMSLYAGGATLVLQGLHRLWPPLIDYTRQLGAELRRPLQVNAYLTPPGSQGFSTHYDTHDVFVLQVDGTKRWRLHAPVLQDPLEKQAWGGRADEVSATAQGEPDMDVVLAPGDALYLPRGWLHSAEAQGTRSLHLTIGVRALTRYAVVEELLALAASDARLRATLPYAVDVSDPEAIEPELTETVEALRDWLTSVDPASVAARLRARDWPSARPEPVSPLAQLDFASGLQVDDHIRVREGLRWQLEDDGPDHVSLRLVGRSMRFPGYCSAALRLALSGEAVRVGDLPLDDDGDRVVLGRRLLKEALVVPGR